MEPDNHDNQTPQVTIENVQARLARWAEQGKEIITLANECPEINIYIVQEITTMIAGAYAMKDSIPSENRPKLLGAAGAIGGLAGFRCR